MKMRFWICLFGISSIMGICSKSDNIAVSEVWPKKGLLVTTYKDVGQLKTDTVYVTAANVAEKRLLGDPATVTNVNSIWTISLEQTGSGAKPYVLIKNEDGEYLKIDSTGSPLGAKEFILEVSKTSSPGPSAHFFYEKDGEAFKLKSAYKPDWYLTSEGHSLGGNGLEFKKTQNARFWIIPR
ncbi:MAG: hypothetical protein H7Y31_11905 [Chitinophagaceae bacterium]|nr:hypothetical protein [Chitinophagaceae bacterium]